MTKPITIPNTFASATSAIPLSQLDQDFSTLANATNDLATYSNYVADTGAADAYIANFPANTNTASLTAGLTIQFKAANANTGASTLNVQVNGSTIGTAAIRYANGSALAAGAIAAGAMVSVMYDGTNFQLINDPAGQSGGDVTGPASATDNAIARFDGATGKLIQNSVVTIADTTGDMSGVGTLSAANATIATNLILSAGTANQVQFLNASKVVSGSANLTFNGTTLTVSDITDSSLTANRVIYAGTGGNLLTSANLTFNGTTFTSVNDASISGLTVGKGAGSVATNTAVGANALTANTTGVQNTAVGSTALQNFVAGYNTAFGAFALTGVGGGASIGQFNTAVGVGTGTSITSGSGNTFLGMYAGVLTTTGSSNVAVGGNGTFGTLGNNTTGSNNTAVGLQALQANTTASNNTAVGYQAGYSNTTGTTLTAFGGSALRANTTGADNTAVGFQSLLTNTTGNSNIAMGRDSLVFNTTGSANVGLGFQSLFSNTTASNNTAVGYQAGYSNTTGDNFVAVGYVALAANTTGQYHTAVGRAALNANTTGGSNSAFGYNSLASNTTGSANVGLGHQALGANTTASNNTAVGYQASYSGTTGQQNTTMGWQSGFSNVTGSNNAFYGYYSGQNTTSSNNTFIGNGAGYQVTSGAKNTVLGNYNGNQDGLDMRTLSNRVVISDGDGNRQLTMYEGGTVALDSALPAAGTGITFPATQSASSDANTLDDYEEGTFTPTVFGLTTAGTVTYNTQTGRYTKIGNIVTIRIYLDWTNLTGTGNITIGGLPFTSTSVYGASIPISYFNSIALTANNVMTGAGYINPSATTIGIDQYPVGGGNSAGVQCDAAGVLIMGGTYQV